MFEPLPSRFDFPEAEKKVLAFWERHRVFERSLERRADAPRFVFYEGPPTANGLPHPGHCLTRAMKDLFPRYRTMCGFLVERKAGWDTHGLPVEVEVCKELGIHGKEEIEAYGVEKFNLRCIQSVFRYTREWEEMTRRLGFWVNLDEAYATYHKSYVESVWWSLKTLFERGLLYQGHKVVWWWAQGGTALSSGEVGEGYRTVDDPSVFVKFPLVSDGATERRSDEGARLWRALQRVERMFSKDARPNEEDEQEDSLATAGVLSRLPSAVCSAFETPEQVLVHLRERGREFVEKIAAPISLLVWTTTPWTLVSNHFAAVHPDLKYALVHDAELRENLFIAADLVETVTKKVKRELEVLFTFEGHELVGKRYLPPFPEVYHERAPHSLPDLPARVGIYDAGGERLGDLRAWKSDGGSEPVGWRVLGADFVTIESGTGLVHEAPAFGEVDFELLQKERQRFEAPDAIPLLCAVNPDGTFNNEAPPQYRGRWVKDCDREIVRELKERTTPWDTPLLYHQETYRHDYPFCPRAENDPLIQYARKSWFVRTSRFKDEFLRNNATVNWLPEHIREGRFGDFLRNNVDWALSRERYWGTPLPIWVCAKCGTMDAIGSFDELRGKPGATDDGYWERKVAEHAAEGETLPDHLRVHKPYIDEWTFACEAPQPSGEKCGGTLRRVPEVIDCWWDAGSMPFAQWGFPHAPGSVDTFHERFPADFISEAIDQTRGWFYGLLAISTLLFKDGIPQLGSAGVPPATPPTGTGSAGVSPAMPSTGTGSAGMPPAGGAHRLSAHAVGPGLHERRRRRIPHWESGGMTYFVTFSTATSSMPEKRDSLSEAERGVVLAACRHWDGARLLLHAAVVMPDHVHLLVTPLEQVPGKWWGLADLLHSIKRFSAKQVNELRGCKGRVWQPEYYDRGVRSLSDFDEKLRYIVTNPERAGLGDSYPWLWVETDTGGRDARAPREAEEGGRDARAPREAEEGGRDARAPLGYPLPYRTCIVLGHMAGEDGLKMSKRKKNYREPSYIFDHYGADAMRWYFFSAQTPWTSVRFQEAAIRDTQREFLVKLYNVLSFFSIYASIDGFTAGAEQATGRRPPAERGELDRWILSALHLTIRDVRAGMDRFENYPAAQRLSDFVDALSNWYVRRSRDRFWRSAGEGGQDQDKWDAYNTLYECLLTLSRLVAPFTPFFAETMYQHLRGTAWTEEGGRDARAPRDAEQRGTNVGEVSGEESAADPISVHLCDYPQPDDALIDPELAAEMDLVREIVSLGRAARTDARIKVRQPLGQVEIILARHEHEEWLRAHSALIAEELNVKHVEFTAEADHYVRYQVKPNFKAIGPKFGKLAPAIAAALGKLPDPADARRRMLESGELTIDVNGQAVTLTPDEVEIRLDPREGWAAAQGRAGVVVIRTEITPELRDEGLIRELVHHVQAARKDQNLPYEARIHVQITAEAVFSDVVRRFEDILRSECLAATVEYPAEAPAGAADLTLDGHRVQLRIEAR